MLCAADSQALMDLGATICTPKNPKCGECPVNRSCLAYAEVSFRLASLLLWRGRAYIDILLSRRRESSLRRTVKRTLKITPRLPSLPNPSHVHYVYRLIHLLWTEK